MMNGNVMDILLYSVAGIALIYSCYTDYKERKIKNAVTFPLMLFGLVIHSLSNGLDGLWFSLQGLLLVGFAAILLSFVGGLGMGDVKLFMAIGACMGSAFVIDTFAFSCLVFVMSVIIFRPRNLVRAYRNIVRMLSIAKAMHTVPVLTEKESALTMPFAFFIGFGFILSMITGGEWIWSIFAGK
jgi:prepilin peptidase CpaA